MKGDVLYHTRGFGERALSFACRRWSGGGVGVLEGCVRVVLIGTLEGVLVE